MRHDENHRIERIGWLRASVLGANDGIVTMASLLVGLVAGGAAAGANLSNLLTVGLASLVAGAMSMAAGEYVSVSSQADTERADLAKEQLELAESPEHEHAELTAIYVARGLDHHLASQVATQLTQHDALGAHARDELGLSGAHAARPMQAAWASAATFALGASWPLVVVLLAHGAMSAQALLAMIAVSSVLCLALLGAVAAKAGGAGVWLAVWRVSMWGALAMAVTAGIGAMFGVQV